MSSINMVILSGYLGKDAGINVTSGGRAKIYFSLATTKRFKSKKTDQYEDRTTWHDVVMWGELAAKLHRDLARGTQVTVQGELDKRSYDKDGEKRYVTEVKADTIVFLSKRRSEEKTAKEEDMGLGAFDGAGRPDDDEPPF